MGHDQRDGCAALTWKPSNQVKFLERPGHLGGVCRILALNEWQWVPEGRPHEQKNDSPVGAQGLPQALESPFVLYLGECGGTVQAQGWTATSGGWVVWRG